MPPVMTHGRHSLLSDALSLATKWYVCSEFSSRIERWPKHIAPAYGRRLRVRRRLAAAAVRRQAQVSMGWLLDSLLSRLCLALES